MTTQTSLVEAEHGRPGRPRSEQAERATASAWSVKTTTATKWRRRS